MLSGKYLRIVLVTFGCGVVGCGPAMVTQGNQDIAKSELAKPAVAIVLGARQEAPAPPPAKAPPRPPMTTPAFYYEPVGPFFFYVETLTSANPSRYGVLATVPCIQSGVFKRGMRLVFRYEILERRDGQAGYG